MEQKIFKVCLLGDTNVGKTSILERYVFNTFNPHTDTTIGAQFLSKTIEYNNTIVKLPYKESIHYMDTDESLDPSLNFDLIEKTKNDYKCSCYRRRHSC